MSASPLPSHSHSEAISRIQNIFPNMVLPNVQQGSSFGALLDVRTTHKLRELFRIYQSLILVKCL